MADSAIRRVGVVIKPEQPEALKTSAARRVLGHAGSRSLRPALSGADRGETVTQSDVYSENCESVDYSSCWASGTMIGGGMIGDMRSGLSSITESRIGRFRISDIFPALEQPRRNFALTTVMLAV